MSRDAASVTLVGRAGSHPQLSMGSTGDRVSLRVVATERRFDKTADDWVNGDEFGVTVVCWKTLATAVLNTVRKGDPVIVGGRIATRRFEKDGVTQYFTEVKADFVGLDVAKAGNRFTRTTADPRSQRHRRHSRMNRTWRPTGQTTRRGSAINTSHRTTVTFPATGRRGTVPRSPADPSLAAG